eukprot:Opistho-2@33446
MQFMRRKWTIRFILCFAHKTDPGLKLLLRSSEESIIILAQICFCFWDDVCVGLSVQHSKMAKSKNHTNQNQNKKAHRNGIKRPQSNKYPSLRGVDPKFLKNLRYARKGNK